MKKIMFTLISLCFAFSSYVYAEENEDKKHMEGMNMEDMDHTQDTDMKNMDHTEKTTK